MRLLTQYSRILAGAVVACTLLLPYDKSAIAQTVCSNPDDLFLNPFSADSAHHRPIGTGARYAARNAQTTRDWLQASRISINPGWQQFGNWIDVIKRNDTEKTVRWNGRNSGLNLPVRIRLPSSVRGTASNPQGQWDNVITLYDPATRTAHEFFKFDWNNGNPTASIYRSYSFTGLGHSTSRSGRIGTSASGAALMFGSLRGHEIETPGFKIGHSLSIALPFLRGKNDMISPRVIPPAAYRDGSASKSDRANGSIPYGALLALPPSVNINSLGLSEKGRRLAEAIRDYGLYVTDATHGGSPAIQADQHITAATRAQLVQKDIPKIYPHIRMVLNSAWRSGQSAVGGGQPLAPNCAFDAGARRQSVSTTAQSAGSGSTEATKSEAASGSRSSSADGTLSWPAVSRAQNYYVEIRDTTSRRNRVYGKMVSPKAGGCSNGGTCEHAAPTLPSHRSYRWSVRAIVNRVAQAPSSWQALGENSPQSTASSSPDARSSTSSERSTAEKETSPGSANGALSWPAVRSAQNYYLEIRDTTSRRNRVYGKMVSPKGGGCSTGGTCKHTFPALPGNREYQWAVGAVVSGKFQGLKGWRPIP